MPTELESLEDLKWEESEAVAEPAPAATGFATSTWAEPETGTLEDLKWEESEPVGEMPPAGPTSKAEIENPRWEDSEPLDPGTLNQVQILPRQEPGLFAAPAKPKSLWQGTKDWLRSVVSPIVGATQEQMDADVKALLSADPEAVKDLFDEQGNLTGRGGSAWNALMRGIDQAQGMGYGLGMLGSDLVGADRLSAWLKSRMEMNQAQIAANPPMIGAFENIGKGYEPGISTGLPRLRQAVTYGVESLAENIPMMVPSLVGGGLSGVAAKKILTRGLAKGALKEALAIQVNKRVALGQAAGIYAGAAGQEAGSIYADMVAQGTQGPVPAMVAALGGMAAGALDAITPFLAIRRAGGAAIASPIERWIRSTAGEAFAEKGLVKFGTAGFESIVTEGPTEYLQTAIEQAARMSQDPREQGSFWQSFWNGVQAERERREAAIKGGIAGGGVGMVAQSIALARGKITKAADKRAFDLGLQFAMKRMAEPRTVTVTTDQGTRIPLEVPPGPGPTMPPVSALPPVPGIAGPALVDQALSLGLERTAAALSGQPAAPLSLAVPEVGGPQPAAAPGPAPAPAPPPPPQTTTPTPAPAPAATEPAAGIITAGQLAQMTPADFFAAARPFTGRYGGGVTGMAHELGASLTSPEQLDELRQVRQKYVDLNAEAMAAARTPGINEADFMAQMSKARDYSLMAQYAREAIQAATGENKGASVDFIRNYHDPNYQPPLPQFNPETRISAPGAQATPVATSPQPVPAESAALSPAAVEPPGASPAQAAALAPAARLTGQGAGLQTQLATLFPHLPNLEVVDDASQLPAEVKAQARAKGIDLDALDAVYHNGRVIFNATRFPAGNPTLVAQKVVHEAGIHLGLRQALGPQRFAQLMQDTWRGLTPNDRARIAARNRIAPSDAAQIGEEWLAYEAEKVVAAGKTNSVWSRIAAAVRPILRRLGFRVRLSDVEIANLITRGLRGAEAAAQLGPAPGAAPTPQRQATRFSANEVSENPVTGLTDLENADTGGSIITRFSVRDYATWRQDAIAQITKGGQVDQATAQRWLDDLDEVAVMVQAMAEREGLLDQFPEGQPARGVMGGPVIKNTPYIFSWDGSGVCTLRLPALEYLNAVTEELGRRGVATNMLPAEREIVLNRLMVAGMPRMCAVCYVETRRALRAKYAALWAKWLTNEPIDEQDLTQGMLEPPDKIANARRRFMRQKVRFADIDQTVFIDEQRWQQAEADPNSHLNQHLDLYRMIHNQSIQNANLVFGRQSYTGQYRFLTDDHRQRQLLQGGLRFYSISDFLFEHAVDIMQALADAAAGGFPGHVYTKQPETAQLLAKTNMKLNLSWIPIVGKDGKLQEWQGMSFPWEEAVRLKRGNPNIGIIFLAFTDEQIRWAMDHPEIGQIIPYHRSGMYQNQFDAYVRQQGWQDYTGEERVTIVNPARWARFEAEFRKRMGDRYTPEYKIGWFLQGQAMTDLEIVTQALADADRFGFELPFQRFMTDADGNPVPGAAKLLKDYARTDTPQVALQPVFDRNVFNQLLASWTKRKSPVLGKQKGNIIKVSDRIVRLMADDLETYRREVARDPAYEDAVWNEMVRLQLEYGTDPVSSLSSRRTSAGLLPKPDGTTRMSVSETEVVPPEPIDQPLPGVFRPGGPGPEEPVEGHDEPFVTRASVTPLTVSHADVDRVLSEAGLPPRSQMLSKPDEELLRNVQKRMNTELGWIDSIVDRELKQPGLLTDEETLALDYWMLQLRANYEEAARQGEQAERAGDTGAAAVAWANADFWSKPLQQLAEVTSRAGTEAGRAFRARQLALQWDFTLASLIRKKREANGWEELTEEQVRELARTANKYKDLSDRLEAENRKLRERDVDAEIAAARGEIAKINPQVLEYAQEWIGDYRARAKNARDRFKVKWERMFPTVPMRTSIRESATPELPEDLMRELAIMGGAKLAENITDQAEWEAAMVADTGEFIRPYLTAARAASEAHLAQQLAAGRAELQARRAPRKVPAAPGTAPSPTPPPRTPTVEEEIEVTKAKIHQVVEKRKGVAEPTRTAEDELYYPVQALVRQFIEQNPLITRDQLVAAVYGVLQVEIPEITIAETMDAISGRGRIRKPDPEHVAKTMRDLKAQIRLASHILDVEARRPLKRTGYQPDKPTDEQRRLIAQLNELKRRIGEVVTDPAAQLASYLDARKNWYRHRIADLQHEIAKRELIVRTKSPERTDAELESLRAEYDQLREEHAKIFLAPELTPEQRLAMAERAAERILAKMEKDLAEGRVSASRSPSKLASARLEALRTRIVQIRAEQEWAQRHLSPPPDLKDPADIRRWFALDRSIRRIENQLASGNPFGPGKRVRATEKPSNQILAARLEALKLERQEMRERLGPGKPSPLEQAIASRMAQLRRQIADYQGRIASRDFTPRRRPEPTDLTSNSEAVRLLAERDRVVADYYKQLQQDRYNRKTRLQKIGIGIKNALRADINLRSSFDVSGLRQGLLGMLSLASRTIAHPFAMPPRIGRVFGQMFEALWSKDRADRIMTALKQRTNAQSGADRIAKIEYSDIQNPTFTRTEENARSFFDEWAELPLLEKGRPIKSALTALPKAFARGVAGSNRAFAVFLNGTRAALFDQLLAENFQDRPPTENELRVIGNWVNVATGRGKMNPKIAEAGAAILWSPKLLTSRIQFLIGQPLWGGGGGGLRESGRARAIIAKEYARVLGSGALLAIVASFFDEKKERSPLSSDFGKIVRGNTRIDLWGGLQQVAVLMSRVLAGKTKTLKGDVRDIAAGKRFGQGNVYHVIADFLRTKLRPDLGVGLDLLSRGDFRGEPITVAGVAEDLLVPLPFAGIVDIMRDRGWSEGTIAFILNQFGAGVSVYEPTGAVRQREVRTQ